MTVLQGARATGAIARPWTNAGPPASGTSGTLVGAAAGDLLLDTTNGVLYINEGSTSSPYWTPCGYDQAPLFGVWTDFRDQAGKATTDTAAEAVIPGSGLRVFGAGVAVNDSGLTAQTAAEGGIVGRLTSTDAADAPAAIGMDAGVMQPDQHGQLVLDVELTHVSAITNRAMFVGFLGTAADGLVEAVTGATITATLVQDDLAGVFFDTGFTDGDRLYAVHNKSNEAASQDVTASGRDTSTDTPAAGTYQRLRVEINEDGDMLVFADKVQIASISSALDADEEVSPVVYIAANTTAVQSIDVRRFATWANRA